jgi:two-component sensor histidine kinase/DNA-binding response OmpR family regulator
MSDQSEPVNVLLVDDQPAKLISYEVILSGLGQNLIRASSGKEALEILLKTEVAVILVDVCMPELDGFQLAAMIREHPRFQKTAIIFISAIHLGDMDRLRGYEMGAVDYVPVPVIPEVLRAKVKIFVELYRKTRQLEAMNAELEQRVAARTAELERTATRLRDSEQRRSLALVAGHMGSWDWDRASGKCVWDDGQYRIFDVDPEEFSISPESIRPLVHPDDWQQMQSAFDVLFNKLEPVQGEFRIRRPGGDMRWCFGTAAPTADDHGHVIRISGVTMDITARKQAEERQSLLAREIDHRAKNILALVQSIVLLTRAGDVQAYAKAIEGRIRALSAAHTLLSQSRWEGASLHGLVQEELAPYGSIDGIRVTVEGPDVVLQSAAAQGIALALHELVTNAAKYGALSQAGGNIELTWSLDADQLVLRWVETGAALISPPTSLGFGTKIIRGSIEGQLSGKATFDWRPHGLACRLAFPRGGNMAPKADAQKYISRRNENAQPTQGVVVHGNRILIVEDEPLVAMSLRDSLRELGFAPLGPFHRIGDAMVALRRNAIDGAILDVNLRGEMIYPLAHLLAAEKIPFIFLTGYGSQEIDPRFSHVPTVQKPLHPQSLRRIFFVDASQHS